MANGLLGKKTVNAADTEMVYTVPSAKVATFNVNIINNSADTANVFMYISSDTYQSADFSTFNVTTDAYASSYKARQQISQGLVNVIVTEALPAAAVTNKTALTDHTAGTTTYTDINSAIKGNPVWFYRGDKVYVRDANTGATRTLNAYSTNSGASHSPSNFGFTSGDNILFAPAVDGQILIAYKKGGTQHNKHGTYRTNSGNWATNWNVGKGGTINCISGVKCTAANSSERFLMGMSSGNVYFSTNTDPAADSQYVGPLTLPSSVSSGKMMGAVTTNESTNIRKLFIVFDNAYVAYIECGNDAGPTTLSLSFAFPSGLVAANVIDVFVEGTALCLLSDTWVKHTTSDYGVNWATSPYYAEQQYELTVAADAAGANKFAVQGVLSPELELVRGATYVFQQLDATNNSHPFSLSTTADGTHGGGVVYETGQVWYQGNPQTDSNHEFTRTTHTQWKDNFNSHNTEPRLTYYTVPSNAPDTLYGYCHTHSGMGFKISVVNAPSVSGEKWLNTQTIWDSTGDATKKIDLFFDGTRKNRIKRFNAITSGDLYDKAGLTAGGVLERTAVMASAGEQVIVKSDKDDVIVRVHGIEE